MKRVKILSLILIAVFVLVSCKSTAKPTATPAAPKAFGQASCAPNCKYSDMTMCFPQLGAESDWRTADTASFKDEATKDGFKLVFSDAQQNQENQIAAVR